MNAESRQLEPDAGDKLERFLQRIKFQKPTFAKLGRWGW